MPTPHDIWVANAFGVDPQTYVTGDDTGDGTGFGKGTGESPAVSLIFTW